MPAIYEMLRIASTKFFVDGVAGHIFWLLDFLKSATNTKQSAIPCLMVRAYPFIPKTTAKIQVGDYWPINLEDSRYAVGRVLQVLDRVTIFGAVLDWSGEQLPTEEAIAGAPIIAAGRMHIKTIVECGEGILGNRNLDADGINIPLYRSHWAGPGQRLMHGGNTVGPLPSEHRALPVSSSWGFGVARIRANLWFCQSDLAVEEGLSLDEAQG